MPEKACRTVDNSVESWYNECRISIKQKEAVTMILKAEKRRCLAGLLCTAALLGGCGMIVDHTESDFHDRTQTTASSALLTEQTGTSERTSEAVSEQTAPADSSDSRTETTSASAALSSSEPSGTTTASTGRAASSAAGTSTTKSASSAASSGTTAPQSTESSGSTTVTTLRSGKLSQSDQAFLADCVFVGDSICSGLSVYKILPASNVVAKGSVGVRSIFDYSFKVNGTNCNVVQALSALKPKTVIFSMGMNDINMTTSQKYCENYQNLLGKVQAALPNAKLCVASITPITTASKFSTNAKIDSYNAAIRDYLAANYPSWTYLNIAPGLKNEWNALRSNYTSGDGIHLAPAAYQVILSEVCALLAPKSSQTTAAD